MDDVMSGRAIAPAFLDDLLGFFPVSRWPSRPSHLRSDCIIPWSAVHANLACAWLSARNHPTFSLWS